MDPNQHEPSDVSPEHERIGHTLENRYRILEVLAQGGMGVVYRGERLGLNRTVAIKFLHASFAANPQAQERFERELQAMSRLTHPNCVSVIDYGIADSPFIVMEFVTGRTLKDVLTDEDRVQPTRALFIVNQILGALAHAHSQDMVHRDIKPANVVLASVEGVMDHVYVLDFGLAKFLSSAAKDRNELTASWMVLGTPAYMSPEQSRAETIGAATDIYATGVLLFELLTGTKPYYAENPIDTIQLHQSAPVPSIRERLPEADFSPELDQVVQIALAKDPAQRFASATAFAEALDYVPEAAPTLTSTRLRALTPIPRLRAESAPPDGAAGGRPGVTSVMAGGHAAANAADARHPPSSTVSLGNSDIQVVSSGPIILARPAAPAPESRAPAVEARVEQPVPTAPSSAAAPTGSPAVARSPRSGSRAARVVLASMLMAVAVVVGWYAVRDQVPKSTNPALPATAGETEPADPAPAPARGEDLPGDERAAPPAPSAPVEEQAAAASPDAAPANTEEQLAVAPPDAGPATPEEQVAGGENTEPTAEDETAEDQPSTRPRTAGTDDNPIKDVEQLVQKGRRDEAIRRILQLRRTDFPRSGYLAYMLGNLYFQKQQWSNGLEAYEDALRLKPDYRGYATINENTIRAFSHRQTWPKARALFVGHIRQAGLKYLRQAAQSNRSTVVRDRAKQVITAINRR
jgi:eukaryotic-like serine/threonine-protein kinase